MRALAVLMLAAGCVQSGEVHCSDGRLCPPGYTCDDAHMRCLSADQVAACSGREEGADCSIAGAPGACHVGACEPLVCGDGVRSVGEACDGTDLGTATCKDAGFYNDTGLACSSFCTFDVSGCTGYCGDGKVNGPELCDGTSPPGACYDFGFDAGSVSCGISCGIGFDTCARFGWIPETTGLDQTYAMAASGTNDIWVVGSGAGTNSAAHFDGSTWTRLVTPGDQGMVAVTANASGDAWGVCSDSVAGTLVAHFVGGQWIQDTTIPAASYADVWQASATAVYVATSNAGVLHWNGSSWQTLGTLATPLSKIEGTSSNDIWAVGADGTLHHWDGTTWTPLAVEIAITSVLDLAPSDIWVIGASTTAPDNAAIGHWNGTQWTITLDPTTNPQLAQQLIAIGGAADNDLWLSIPSGDARHFDGTNWAPAGTVVVNSIYGSFIDVLHVDGQTIAVTFDGFLYRYRGQMYARFNPQSTSPLLASVSFGPNVTVAVDAQSFAHHFDGTTWTKKQIDTNTPVQSPSALWGRAANDIWVSGSGGRIFHFDGASWTDLSSGLVASLQAIIGFSASDVWFFGSATYHYDGGSIASVTGPTSQIIRVAASGPSDIWALGTAASSSELWRWNGAIWSLMTAPQDLHSLAVLAPDNAYAATANRIWHWNGTAWSDQILSALDPIIQLAGTGADDVFALTAQQLFHFDGTQWSPVRTPTDSGVLGRSMLGIAPTRSFIDIIYSTSLGNTQLRRLYRTRLWDCASSETNCADGVDDDCDDRVDGLDSDCP